MKLLLFLNQDEIWQRFLLGREYFTHNSVKFFQRSLCFGNYTYLIENWKKYLPGVPIVHFSLNLRKPVNTKQLMKITFVAALPIDIIYEIM